MARYYLQHQGELAELREARTLVGRVAPCAICFNDTTVSRKHVAIDIADNEQAWLTDLGSRNGTFVNGQRIVHPTPVRHGDRITVGKRVMSLLVVESSYLYEDDDVWDTAQETDVEDLDGYTEPKDAASAEGTHRVASNSIERRRHGRIGVVAPLRYVSDALDMETTAIDVSLSGAFVRTEFLDSIGAECRLIVSVRGQMLQIKGRVCRVVDSDPEHPAGVGIEFTDFNSDAYLWLAETLESYDPLSAATARRLGELFDCLRHAAR